MLKRKLYQNRAQSVLEYAVLITCLVLALVAMQTYIRRCIQGKLRQSTEDLGQQYEPTKTTGTHTLTVSSNSIMEAKTLNEQELGFDLDGDDNPQEEEVYGMTTNNTLNGATTTRVGWELVEQVWE